MTVQIPARHERWLREQVAAGRFSSLEEALDAAVARLRADDDIDDAWARPLVEDALAALDRGEGKTWVEGDILKDIHARHQPRK